MTTHHRLSHVVIVLLSIISLTSIGHTQQTTRKAGSDARVEAVWKLEEMYWRYVASGDADNYRTLWDEGFRGVDPNYALALAGLADSYNVLGILSYLPPKEAYPKARAAALKALEIDDAVAEAHTSLARVKQNYDWDWAGAEQEYKRAIALNPSYPTAHHWYDILLSEMGRHAEALAEAKRAQELDPLSIIINSNVGWVMFNMGSGGPSDRTRTQRA